VAETPSLRRCAAGSKAGLAARLHTSPQTTKTGGAAAVAAELQFHDFEALVVILSRTWKNVHD
jgi:hypothetical protein